MQSHSRSKLIYPASVLYHYGPSKGRKTGFHDITSGGNGGYRAGPGFDTATGFGSLDVAKFDQFVKGHDGF